MDILEIIADASLSGGPKHVLTLTNKLSKFFKITTVCPAGYLSKELKGFALSNKIINFKSSFDPKSILYLRSFIKKHQPKLIHAHGVRAGIITYFAILFLPVKFIYTEHLYTSDYHLKSSLREFVQTTALGFVCRRAIKIIAPSQAVKDFLLSRFQIKKTKILIVTNGLDDFKVLKKDCRTPTIGFIGGSNPVKGLPLLISAMSIVNEKNPKIKLQILGDVDMKVRQNAVNVEFLKSSEVVNDVIGSWQVLVVPSITESFGQVVLEAAIAGIPVIATKVGALPELVKNCVNGLLVEKGDVRGLARAILELSNDSGTLRKMGDRNRQLYERNFTSEIMSLKIRDIYVKIINNED